MYTQKIESPKIFLECVSLRITLKQTHVRNRYHYSGWAVCGSAVLPPRNKPDAAISYFFSKEGFKKELSNCLNDAGRGKERSIQPVSELL